MFRRFTVKSFFCLYILPLCALFLLSSCGKETSVPLFTGTDSGVPSASGGALKLTAFSSEARKGIIRGTGCAVFAFPADALSFPRAALEVTLEISGEDGGSGVPQTADVKLSFLTGDDFDSPSSPEMKLKRRLSLYRKQGDSFHDLSSGGLFYASSILKGCSGSVSLRMAVPDAPSGVYGFAVSVSAGDKTGTVICHASIREASSGWVSEKVPGTVSWAGFPASGGMMESSFPPDNPPGAVVPRDSSAIILFYPVPPAGEEVSPADFSAVQPRAVFSDGEKEFGFRLSPSEAAYSVFQPCVVSGFSGNIIPVSGGKYVRGIYTSPSVHSGGEFPGGMPGESLLDPVTADPHAMVEWPLAMWRKPSREIFRWDRFPSVIVFDTADYDVQNRYFRRLAFFVEKQGYKGRLLTDAELSGKHAFNAHDYRAESLAEFFSAAAASDFPLLDEELELRGILLRNGIITASSDGGFEPGAGAVVSISRASPEYLRYSFIAHESFHAVYFVDGAFREKVAEIYGGMNPVALKFLHGYFDVVDGLGYDTSDKYLMENEFMGYILQNPFSNVSGYFSRNLAERYLRYGGDRETAGYITAGGAEDFVYASAELCRYVYNRWGLTGGRVGMHFWDD